MNILDQVRSLGIKASSILARITSVVAAVAPITPFKEDDLISAKLTGLSKKVSDVFGENGPTSYVQAALSAAGAALKAGIAPEKIVKSFGDNLRLKLRAHEIRLHLADSVSESEPLYFGRGALTSKSEVMAVPDFIFDTIAQCELAARKCDKKGFDLDLIKAIKSKVGDKK